MTDRRYEFFNPHEEEPGWGNSQRLGRELVPPANPIVVDTTQLLDDYMVITVSGYKKWDRARQLLAILNAANPIL